MKSRTLLYTNNNIHRSEKKTQKKRVGIKRQFHFNGFCYEFLCAEGKNPLKHLILMPLLGMAVSEGNF